MISRWPNKAEHIREKQKEWRENHRTVRISLESHDALIRWSGRLQSETGELKSISDALVELIRRVDEHDLKLIPNPQNKDGDSKVG